MRERGDEIPYMPWCGAPPALTPEQVAELRAWARFGTNMTAVARRLGVDRRTVYRYVQGRHKRRYP